MENDNAIGGKNRFLAYISHDLRMPVAGIKGMADIALGNLDDKEKLKDCLGKISASSDYLLSLVNNILDIAQYGSGELVCRKTPFNIEEFLDGCTDVFKGLMYGRKLIYSCCYSGLPVIMVTGDSIHLKQVLVNIFENSVKYTPDGGKISFNVEEVRYDNESVTYCFIISDTGKGMSREYIKELFEPFSQEDKNDNARYAGNGLGMAITKQFTDMLKGDIEIISSPGKGTTFKATFTFDIDKSGSMKEDGSTPVDFTGMNFLVVDDSDINAGVLCELLKQRGAYASMALDGRSAVETFKNSDISFFDAVLMDVTMPVMDGLEATKQIRSLKRPDAAVVPVIAMTGNVFKDDIGRCRKAGMDGHLVKPVNFRELMDLVVNFS